MTQKQTLEIDDVVKVRQGFKDPDTKIDMSGWHGRIALFYPEQGMALITFDSITLQNLPQDYIDECESEGLSWSQYDYDLTDLTKVKARDTTADVTDVMQKLANQYIHNYFYLGEEGREIQHIMKTIDPQGNMAAVDVWLNYLEQELKFPIEAVVDEWLRSPLTSGDSVRIHAIEYADEHYGIIVKLRRGRKQFHTPLFQLAAANENSREHDLIDLYRTWFANQ